MTTKTDDRFFSGAVLLAIALVWLVLFAGCATAPPQRAVSKAATVTCGAALGHYLDSTANGSADPRYDRAFAGIRLTWRGRPWLLVNRGNEIQLWDVTDPARPVLRSTSNFNIPNQGDSDYDLLAFAVCDDCRWGIAWYKLGTVTFDLGTSSQPTWAAKRYYPGATSGLGGATWSHAGTQWLATSSLGGDCGIGSTLYTVSGLDTRIPYGCIIAGPRPVTVARGIYDRGSVYLIDSSTRLYRYLAGAAGLTYQAEMGRASYGGNSWTGLDAVPGILVVASTLGTVLWDTADPALPIQTATIPGAAGVATVAPPLLVTGLATADPHRERVYDISDPAAPVELDANLWPDEHAFAWPESATLIGGVGYFWRYSIAETFDLAGCVEPAPVAELFHDGWESGGLGAWDEVVP